MLSNQMIRSQFKIGETIKDQSNDGNTAKKRK